VPPGPLKRIAAVRPRRDLEAGRTLGSPSTRCTTFCGAVAAISSSIVVAHLLGYRTDVTETIVTGGRVSCWS